MNGTKNLMGGKSSHISEKANEKYYKLLVLLLSFFFSNNIGKMFQKDPCNM